MRLRFLLLPVFIALTLLAACQLLDEEQPAQTAVSPSTLPAAAEETAPLPPTPAAAASITGTQPLQTITLWVPPVVVARTESGEDVLAEQLQAFTSQRPDISAQVTQKLVAGQGGIVSYLRTARDVAPSILPDVAVLPANLLSTLAIEEQIYPLDNFVDPQLLESLYPPAQQMALVGEQIYAYPFALKRLPHLIYNTEVITRPLPLTWDQLIALPEQQLVLAADGADGATLGLQFYSAAGGRIADEEGQPLLEEGPLTTALQELDKGRANGFILPQSSELVSVDESWQIFQSGAATIARTTTDAFLLQRSPDAAPGFVATAGIDRPLTPYVYGWTWAITTPDPERQAAAIELITWLMRPENLGAWSQASAFLPATPDALATWPEDPYVRFSQQELGRAEPLPVAETSRINTVIGNAVFEVISGSSSPEEAAATAVQNMEQ